MPVSSENTPVPWVIMAHGHGGDREEAGSFRLVAEALAARGIASIRLDFPGCGQSTEPFTQNSIRNMLEDIRSARRFALEKYRFDSSRLGILGYSMGGRLAVLSSLEIDYQAMVLWAPVGLDGAAGMERVLGGREAWHRLYDVARREGSALYVSPWGKEQVLGRAWFDDMDRSRPQAAISAFEGPLLILHGDADDAVSPVNGSVLVAEAVRANPVEAVWLEGVSHDLGFRTGNDEPARTVVQKTAEFLASAL